MGNNISNPKAEKETF